MSTNLPIGQISSFKLTGVDRQGKRFSFLSSSYSQACMYNLYCGSMWAIMENGKKKLLKRVFN